MAGQRGVRDAAKPHKRKTHISDALKRKFTESLPPSLKAIYKAIPDPTEPGFLACQARLLLALQHDLMRHYLEAERDSERMHSGRMLLDVAELLRRTIATADDLDDGSGMPQQQHHTWETPVFVHRDEDGSVKPAEPPSVPT